MSASDWEIGKQRHRELSDESASRYDDLYEQANFATASYMAYELEQVERASKMAPGKAIAIDLGCGTGRDTFKLAQYFDQVYGFDFSPQMIARARQAKVERRVGNVKFEVADVDDGLPQLQDGMADMVNSSFGMGSFVERPADLFNTIRRLLKPGGVGLMSFYNRDALVNLLQLEWRPALAARVSADGHGLTVDFDGTIYEIAAQAYSVPEIRDRLKKAFPEVSVTTFPTLTALLPQSVFAHEQARELCRRVDAMLADNVDLAAGPYIVATVKVGGKAPKARPVSASERVNAVFRQHGFAPTRHEHAPVRDMVDVGKAFPHIGADRLIKSIVVALDDGDDGNDDEETKRLNAPLWCFAIPASRRMDFGKVARLLNVGRDSVHMATVDQVERRTGFSIGSIPPVGMPKHVPVFVDASIDLSAAVLCGSGRSTESFEMTGQQLVDVTTASIADVTHDPEADEGQRERDLE